MDLLVFVLTWEHLKESRNTSSTKLIKLNYQKTHNMCYTFPYVPACPTANQFTCNDGQCIPHAQFCDGFSDCEDKSDEPFGCGGECKSHEWKCG
jgi:hypothetical protein